MVSLVLRVISRGNRGVSVVEMTEIDVWILSAGECRMDWEMLIRLMCCAGPTSIGFVIVSLLFLW